MSNYSYGIGILLTLILLTFYWTDENNPENGTIFLIFGILIFLSLIVGRIARIVSGGYFWHHIKNDFKINQDSIELENERYEFDKIKLLKFNITDYEKRKPFLYQHILKDTRNMIKFVTTENIIQVHFKPENKSENEYLTELKKMRNAKNTVANNV
ncbi:hypothetical protein [Allomuricauda sp. F6463D]|uniref:hypothetical protein n=1 Tax=Allomuricauda sp. F6463D TaxID=2926409 RepID=UPI001FF3B93A|nr:hypothetical protein [Muricauda sp. F6463D]